VQCLTQALDQAFLGDRAVPQLATFVVDDDPDDRSEAVDDASALTWTEPARCRDVETQFDAGRGAIGVLAAGAARRRESNLELATRDSDRPRHHDLVVVHPTDRGTPALPYGAGNG
jgi:hypothetical protein